MSVKRYVSILLIACVLIMVYLPSFSQAGDTGHIVRNAACSGRYSKILQTSPHVHPLVTSQPDGEGSYGTKDNGTPRAADLDGVTKADHDCEASGTSKGFFTYHLDHLGSVRLITDEEGEVVWPADFETNGPARYTPFGEQYRPSTRSYDGTVLTSLRFTSKEFDAESQLSDFGARFLEHAYPARFVTQDPSLSASYDLTNPQTFNLYTYGLNNPVRYKDPNGEFVWDALDVISFGWSVGSFIAAPGWGTGIDLALDTIGLLPGVPGAGTVKHGADLAEAGYDLIRGVEKIDDAGDAVKATKRGARNPKVKAALERGKKVHKEMEYPEGFEKEVTLPSGKRMDAYNEETKEIIELKPNNPRAVKRGEKQVGKYCEECDKVIGPGHSSWVETYD